MGYQFEFVAISQIVAEYNSGTTSKLISSKFQLEIGEGLDRKHYFDKDGNPNKEGLKVIAQCFIQGLNGCIQYAHAEKLRDSSDFLTYIINELERAFVKTPKEIIKGNAG